MDLKDNELRIQIWDDKGNLVVDEVQEVQTVTQEQIDEMVMMIEQGTPAHLASKLVIQGAS